MNKETFLSELKKGLSGLPADDVNERLAFYGEMIDDRVEESMSEEEAVAGIGTVESVVSQTLSEIPLSRIVKEKIDNRRSRKGWEIALIIIGFPLWFPLLVAAAAVVFSLYAVLWALIISLWAVELALWVASLACVAAGIAHLITGYTATGLALLGAGVFCAGLSIFFFFGCVAASRGIIKLTKLIATGIKKMFVGKDASK